jgi:hypothetical protein
MTDIAQYDDRFCAFVDILGFRQLIESLAKDPEAVGALRDVLRRVHSPASPSAREVVRAQSISDAVALSAAVTAEGLYAMLRVLTFLSIDLLCQGFLVRGAIVRGPLFHDDAMVFGKALVDAYHLESEIVRFPRIMVAREVRDDILKLRPALMDQLRQSDDGPMFIDVLKPVADVGRKVRALHGRPGNDEKALHARFQLIKDRLQARYEESMDTPRHFEKVSWFARYWNETVAAHTDYQRVLGAGLEMPIGLRR